MKRRIEQSLERLAAEPLLFVQRAVMAAAFATLFAGVGLIVQDRRLDGGSGPDQKVAEEYSDALSPKGSAPLEYYLSPIRKRALFKIVRDEPPAPPAPLVVKPAAPAAPSVSVVPVKTLAELSADLSLVGVLQSAEPQAIILNRKSQKTHYLSVGQAIGEIRVVKIQQDRVTLGYNDETLDLSM